MILYFVATESMYALIQDHAKLPLPIQPTAEQLRDNVFLTWNPGNYGQLMHCNERYAIDYAYRHVFSDSGPVYVYKLVCNDSIPYDPECIDKTSYHIGFWVPTESLDAFNANLTQMEVVHTFVYPFVHVFSEKYSIEII